MNVTRSGKQGVKRQVESMNPYFGKAFMDSGYPTLTHVSRETGLGRAALSDLSSPTYRNMTLNFYVALSRELGIPLDVLVTSAYEARLAIGSDSVDTKTLELHIDY